MRYMGTIAVALAFVGIVGCTTPPNANPPGKPAKTALDWASEAAELRKQDKKEEALKAYDEAIRIDADLEVAHFNRALIYAELGRDEEAAAARDRLAVRKSDLAKNLTGLFRINAEANIAMGSKYAKAGDLKRALEKYNVALVYDRNLADAYIGRGIVYIGQEKFDDAIQEFDQAIKLEPKSSAAYYNRGRANLVRKQFKLAEGDYTKAIELEPNNPDSYSGRAALYEAMGENAKAQEDRDRAARLTPKKNKTPGT